MPEAMLRILIRVLLGVIVVVPAGAQQVTLPQAKGSVRFAIIGDSGTGERAQYETAERLRLSHEQFPFDFVLMMGDNIYGSKTPQDFQRKFELPYKPLLDNKVTFYASLGNHDVPEEQSYKLFNMDGRRYYSFKKGNVRFFALDSNYMDPDQLTWLTNQLQGSADEWRIAFFHHPLYSSAAAHGSSLELRGILEPLFQQHGVQVVFSGHDHVYERMTPQKGIAYFTEGSSGQLRRGNIRGAEFSAKSFDTDCAFMLVEITSNELYFQTISRTGETVDSGKVARAESKKESVPAGSQLQAPLRTPPPAAPLGSSVQTHPQLR
jgi:predicted MPP superfamily phosphohydrolase